MLSEDLRSLLATFRSWRAQGGTQSSRSIDLFEKNLASCADQAWWIENQPIPPGQRDVPEGVARLDDRRAAKRAAAARAEHGHPAA